MRINTKGRLINGSGFKVRFEDPVPEMHSDPISMPEKPNIGKTMKNILRGGNIPGRSQLDLVAPRFLNQKKEPRNNIKLIL